MKAISREYLISTLKGYEENILNKKFLTDTNISVKKLEEAEDGFLASYQLVSTVSGEEVILGETINLPKDYLVKSASIKTVTETTETIDEEEVTTTDGPEGFTAGTKYIDFVINTIENDGNEEHIYIKLDDLMNMTAGDGIDITETTVSVKAGEGLKIDAEDENKVAIDFEAEAIDFSDWND